MAGRWVLVVCRRSCLGSRRCLRRYRGPFPWPAVPFWFRYTAGLPPHRYRGTEVALAQGQRVTHDPVLDEAYQGVVDGGVAVGVVVAHDVADNARGLIEGAVGAVAAVEHGVDDAAVYWFQAVSHIGQGTSHDHGHGVIEV